ncbi:MAG: plastocyanin/azurin family copper-binding protein [Actinomycetes bacterium]
MKFERTTLRLPALLAVAATASLAAVGCGSESSMSSVANPGTAAETTTAAAPKVSANAQKLAVTSPADGSLVFEPKALTAKAGDVTIVYKNPSPVPHNAVIVAEDGKTVIGTESKPFTNGEGTSSATLKAGKYKFICEVPGHEQGGMIGDLTVS